MALLKFEVINPHDPYVMEAETFEVACVAALLLAEGQYGLTSLDEPKGKDMPVMIFWNDDDYNKWSHEAFGKNLEQMLEEIEKDKAHKERVALALDTIRIQDGKQITSMTDLAKCAKKLAKGLREKEWN